MPVFNFCFYGTSWWIFTLLVQYTPGLILAGPPGLLTLDRSTQRETNEADKPCTGAGQCDASVLVKGSMLNL